MNHLTGFDIEQLEKKGPGEARYIRLLRGICLNIIDVRSEMICILSADDGEWTDGKTLPKLAKEFKRLMKRALNIAENCTDDYEWLVFYMMTEACHKEEQTEILPW